VNDTASIDVDPTAALERVPAFAAARRELRARPRRWLVTGAAGFIGSHLCEALLRCGQEVVGLDDYSTGSRANLDHVRAEVGAEAARRLTMIEGDVTRPGDVARALRGAEVVLHHAAFVSVPASVEDPVAAHRINTVGFLEVLEAARREGVKRLVYATTSARYGDDDADVKREDRLGRPLSMYAATKGANELYAAAYAASYGLETVGLRYFNVFGARQDPAGAYAAVIPAWIDRLARGEPCDVHGDGLTTRDFCHVVNVVGANLVAATTADPAALNRVYNVGTGEATTLLELFATIRAAVAARHPASAAAVARHGPFRPGDVRHSCADVTLARTLLGYDTAVDLSEGVVRTLDWYLPTDAKGR
jgi:UDP-N-acetylglucosamine/UDP-N-acetylgalactosamine 4-epimerase